MSEVWGYRRRDDWDDWPKRTKDDINSEEARFPWLIAIEPVCWSIPFAQVDSEERARSIVRAHNREGGYNGSERRTRKGSSKSTE